MMILILALALAAAPPVADVPGTLPPQPLANGCAAFLWSNGPAHRLIAMVRAAPPSLRVSIDDHVIDMPLTNRRVLAPLGFAADADYAAASVATTLTMNVVIDPALKDGARIPEATLTLTRPGQDTVIVPASGLIGCAPAPATPPSDEAKVPG